MDVVVDLQNPCDYSKVPELNEIINWVSCVLQHIGYNKSSAELTVRIVDEEESEHLNSSYRAKQKPTNILSFPFEAPPQIDCDLLGDLIICCPIIELEASNQNKSSQNHWAHMLVHGTLHLLGFDHVEETDAEIMESCEIAVLAKFGISNPYI